MRAPELERIDGMREESGPADLRKERVAEWWGTKGTQDDGRLEVFGQQLSIVVMMV